MKNALIIAAALALSACATADGQQSSFDWDAFARAFGRAHAASGAAQVAGQRPVQCVETTTGFVTCR